MLENKTADYIPDVYVWCCSAVVHLPKHEPDRSPQSTWKMCVDMPQLSYTS